MESNNRRRIRSVEFIPRDRPLRRRLRLVFVGAAVAVFAASALAKDPVAATKPAQKTSAPAAAIPFGPDEDLLKEYGVAPTAESLRGCLRAMLPGSDSEQRQRKLIQQLGDDNYHVREAATKSLQQLPVVSSGLLAKAMQGGDPEVRWRAGIILKNAGRRTSDLLHAVLRVISRRKIDGLAAEVLGTMHLCDTPSLRHDAALALSATATAADVARLRKHLDDKSQPVRIAALRAFAKLQGKSAEAELRRLAMDGDDVVKFEAALALLEQGRREAFATMGALLDSKELQVRVRAVQVLRSVSGKRFAFVAYADEPQRRDSVLKWRAWIAAHAQTVAIKFPLRLKSVEVGRTLICDYQRNRLVELDSGGKVVWEHPVSTHPWACRGLPNGHRLVASYSSKSVTEYDDKGKVVWAKTNLPGGPTGLERLDNGNTLIACTDSQQVIEVNRAGETVWSVTISSRPVEARRLETGNTLICLQSSNRVVEVDRSGKTVWEINAMTGPFSAERLESGNTLVACVGSGKVVEFDRAGKEVWSKQGLTSPYCAQRLANGHTLIGTGTGLIEVDRKGNHVWQHAMPGISKFHRF